MVLKRPIVPISDQVLILANAHAPNWKYYSFLYLIFWNRVKGGRLQGMRIPPPWDEAFFFAFSFKICFPHRSVTSFLRGAPPPKKNPGSALQNSFFSKLLGHFAGENSAGKGSARKPARKDLFYAHDMLLLAHEPNSETMLLFQSVLSWPRDCHHRIGSNSVFFTPIPYVSI